MVEVDLKGRLLVQVDSRDITLIKQVPGARHLRKEDRWQLPSSIVTASQLRAVFGDRLELDETAQAWGMEKAKHVYFTKMARLRALDPERDTEGDERLYPFQRTGVAFLRQAGSALLGDDMGTGKTVQSLQAVDQWPLLVVTTKSVKPNWAAEVATWAGGVGTVLDGTPAQRRKALAAFAEAAAAGERVALIVNWAQLASHSRIAGYGSIALKKCIDCGGTMRPASCEVHPREFNEIEWGTVIADEAHKAKDPKAKQTRALWAVAAGAQRFALTGTPMEGSPLDFWSLLHFVAPDEWPSRSRFIDRYCLQEYNMAGYLEVRRLNPATADEFHDLSAPRWLRRPKELVAPWLPEKTPVQRYVEMDPKIRKVYDALEEEFVAELEAGGEIVAFTDLSKGARLLQLAAANLIEDGDSYTMVEPSPKLDELEELLSELGDAPAAVFSRSRQLLRLAEARLEKAKIPFRVIAGDVPTQLRDSARDAYNAGKVRVLLISLGAGAEGLNLTRGSHEIFLDRSWSYLENTQAEDRMHGIGRGDKGATHITVIDILTKDTLDIGRFETLKAKGEGAQALLRDREAVRAMLRRKS